MNRRRDRIVRYRRWGQIVGVEAMQRAHTHLLDRLLHRCQYGGNRKARSAARRLLAMGIPPLAPAFNLHDCPVGALACRCRGGRGHHWKTGRGRRVKVLYRCGTVGVLPELD